MLDIFSLASPVQNTISHYLNQDVSPTNKFLTKENPRLQRESHKSDHFSLDPTTLIKLEKLETVSTIREQISANSNSCEFYFGDWPFENCVRCRIYFCGLACYPTFC